MLCETVGEKNAIDLFQRYIRHTMSSAATDLVVVGAGVLGQLVARRWRSLQPGAAVTLKFR